MLCARLWTFLSMICLLAVLSGPARAQLFNFPNNTIINYIVPGDAIIGDDGFGNPSSPTIELASGGFIGDDMFVNHASVVNITGGSVSFVLHAFNNSTINMTGGNIGYALHAYNDSVVNVKGGTVANYFQAIDSSVINFFGTGLSAMLVNSFPFDPYDQYAISGTLADNTPLNGKTLYLWRGSAAHFNLIDINAVPEPNSLALLWSSGAVGACFVLRRSRT